MNIEDLKVGNYYLYNHPESQYMITTKMDIVLLRIALSYENIDYLNDMFAPMPISEDLLLQFGASHRLVNYCIHEYSIICTPDNYKKEYRLVFRFGEQKNKLFNLYWYPFKANGDMHVFQCEHVNQLQDLYNSITQKRLIISRLE